MTGDAEVSGFPCYVDRYRVRDNISKDEDIRKYIRLAKADDTRGISIFSVTEEDVHYKKWLKIAKEFTGTQIIPSMSREDDYKCYLICVPHNPRLKVPQ